MLQLLPLTIMDKSLKSLVLLALILLLRKFLNVKAGKWASCSLWALFLLYLLCPYGILIRYEPMKVKGFYALVLDTALRLEFYTRQIALTVGRLIAKPNRLIIALLLSLYIVHQSVRTYLALNGAEAVKTDPRIQDCLDLFHFRRPISILVSERSRMPLTFGLFKPKVLLPPEVLADDELLHYVLIHELTHIQQWDILWNHLRYFTACFFWHNLFIWAAIKYMEEDLEIRCDKLVLKKIGDTTEHRRAYCLAMLKLVEALQISPRAGLSLRLHPTLERMKIMKKWKTTFAGCFVLALALCLSPSVFAVVIAPIPNQVVSSVAPALETELKCDRVRILSEEEYAELLAKQENSSRSANITDTATLSAYGGAKHYPFDMSSASGEDHDGFTVKMSQLSSNGNIKFRIIIIENNIEIYNAAFTQATTLQVQANHNSRYKVVILNESSSSLTYTIKINSYIR